MFDFEEKMPNRFPVVKFPLFLAATRLVFLQRGSRANRIFNALQVSWNNLLFYKHYWNGCSLKSLRLQGLSYRLFSKLQIFFFKCKSTQGKIHLGFPCY